MWQDLTMSEVWDILSKDIPERMKGIFSKPDFPTNRWGKLTTKTATEEKHALIKCQSLIEGKSRIVKCKETSELRKRKFYKLQVLTPNLEKIIEMNKKQIPPIVVGMKSEEERELLKQQAEKAGRTLSDYCRRKLLGL